MTGLTFAVTVRDPMRATRPKHVTTEPDSAAEQRELLRRARLEMLLKPANQAPRVRAEADALVRPGVLVIPEFSALGGVSYDRKVVKDSGAGREVRVLRTADHAGVLKESQSIINAAYHVVRKRCVEMSIGYVCSEETLGAIVADLESVRRSAEVFNQAAAGVGSSRRVGIELYSFAFGVQHPVVRRVAEVIAERLREVSDALRGHDARGAQLAIRRCRNLESVPFGKYADIVRQALEQGRAQRRALLAKGGKAHQVETHALDAAVTVFSA